MEWMYFDEIFRRDRKGRGQGGFFSYKIPPFPPDFFFIGIAGTLLGNLFLIYFLCMYVLMNLKKDPKISSCNNDKQDDNCMDA